MQFWYYFSRLILGGFFDLQVLKYDYPFEGGLNRGFTVVVLNAALFGKVYTFFNTCVMFARVVLLPKTVSLIPKKNIFEN